MLFQQPLVLWLGVLYVIESRRGEDCLATTKCALGTAQEELQMVKLALMEKETELLQSQDQLL